MRHRFLLTCAGVITCCLLLTVGCSNDGEYRPVDPGFTVNAAPPFSKIAFESHRDGNGEIYIMNTVGTAQIRLTNNPAWDGEPAISPDWTKIAFSSSRDGNWEIYVMNADGSSQTPITVNSAIDTNPDWGTGRFKIGLPQQEDAFSSFHSKTVDTNTRVGLEPTFVLVK